MLVYHDMYESRLLDFKIIKICNYVYIRFSSEIPVHARLYPGSAPSKTFATMTLPAAAYDGTVAPETGVLRRPHRGSGLVAAG